MVVEEDPLLQPVRRCGLETQPQSGQLASVWSSLAVSEEVQVGLMLASPLQSH